MKVCRIKWSGGIPSIDIGEVVSHTKDGSPRRVKFPGEKKTTQRFFTSYDDAINNEIEQIARVYCRRREVICNAIPQLIRLWGRLERHGLIARSITEKP